MPRKKPVILPKPRDRLAKLYAGADAFAEGLNESIGYLHGAGIALSAASLTALLGLIGLLGEIKDNHGLAVTLNETFPPLMSGGFCAVALWAITYKRAKIGIEPSPPTSKPWGSLLIIALDLFGAYLAFKSFDALVMAGVAIQSYIQVAATGV